MSELPRGWTEMALGDICRVRYGKAAPREDTGSFPVVASAGVIRKTVEPLIQAPVLVIGRKGAVGRVQLFGEPIWPTDTTFFIEPPAGIAPLWLFHQLQFLRLEKLDRSTAVPSLQRPDLESVRIVVAPATEQERIVATIGDAFSRIDAGLSYATHARGLIDGCVGAVRDAAINGRLVKARSDETRGPVVVPPSDDLVKRIGRANADKVNRLFCEFSPHCWALPNGWTWRCAADITESINNGDTPHASTMSSSGGEIPYIKIFNLSNNGELHFRRRPTFIARATHEGPLRRSRLHPGDVLINIVGPPLGQVSIVPADYPEWNTNQAVVAFRASPKILSRLLAEWLLSPSLSRMLNSTARATAGQFNVSLSACRALPIPVPPLAEQDELVATIDTAQTGLSRLDFGLTQAQARSSNLKSAVMAAAFAGRLGSTIN